LLGESGKGSGSNIEGNPGLFGITEGFAKICTLFSYYMSLSFGGEIKSGKCSPRF